MHEKSGHGGYWLRRLGLVTCLALATSCGGRYLPAETAPATAGSQNSGLTGALPPLPSDDVSEPPVYIPREGSVVYSWELHGDEYFRKDEDTAVVNSAWNWLRLVSSDTEESWVIYQFPGLLPEDTPQAITVELLPPIPNVYFIFLPDYSAGIWRWQLVETDGPQHRVELNDWPATVSPGGSFYVAVVGWGNLDTTIGGLALEVDLTGPAPENVRASDGDYEDRILVRWDDVQTATEFNVFRDGMADENIIATVGGSTLMYEDQDATNLDTHTYWLRAVFDSEPGRFSEPDTGYRNGWQRYAIDNNGNVGMYVSMTLIDGRPALSYYDSTNGNLKFARALVENPTSSDDWHVHIVDFNHQVGELTSLAVLDGKPIISYFDNDKGNLKFARAKVAEPDATIDWVYHTVDSEGWVGEYSSVAVVDGLPAISYYDYTNTGLKFARATTPTPSGAADWQFHAVETAGQVGRFSSLAVVNGKPAVSYYGDTGTDLRYAKALISEPSNQMDWRVHVVDGEIDVGLYSAMAVLGDRPMISYYDWSSKSLKFALAHSNDPSSGADWSVHPVNAEGTVSLSPSLIAKDAKPVMTYYGNGDLYYAQAVTDDPSSMADWQILPVDVSGAAGNYSSLTLIDSMPAIAYFGNPGLLYAYAQ
jgi:hypothetical protein